MISDTHPLRSSLLFFTNLIRFWFPTIHNWIVTVNYIKYIVLFSHPFFAHYQINPNPIGHSDPTCRSNSSTNYCLPHQKHETNVPVRDRLTRVEFMRPTHSDTPSSKTLFTKLTELCTSANIYEPPPHLHLYIYAAKQYNLLRRTHQHRVFISA